MSHLDWIIPMVIATSIPFIHFLGEKISEHLKKWHYQLESLGAGLMVGIIFLELLPQITIGEEFLGLYIYIPLLVGFTLIALIEKIVYKSIFKKNPTTSAKHQQHSIKENQIDVEYEKEIVDIECVDPEYHSIFEGIALVTHGLMIGFLISIIFDEQAFQENWLFILIVLIPIIIRAFTLGFSFEQIMDDLHGKQKKILRILGIITPPLGGAIGVIFSLIGNDIALFSTYSLVLGLVLFTVVRDLIPLGKKGKPFFFLIGVIFTIGTFLIQILLLGE